MKKNNIQPVVYNDAVFYGYICGRNRNSRRNNHADTVFGREP